MAQGSSAQGRGVAWQEPPFSELTSWITPVHRFFVRHHLGIPRVDLDRWRLTVEGLVERRIELTLRDLEQFPRVTQVMSFECAGNLPGGGMVGNAEWTGVPLTAVLERAGVKPGALEVILDGADFGFDEGELIPTSYSRSIPPELALAPEILLAHRMNGEPLSEQHGRPLRAVVPGWYAMANVKWLRRIEVTDRPFGGLYMSKRYFTARRDSVTGEFVISPLREMGIKSQIAFPGNGAVLPQEPCRVRGAAWTGSGEVKKVEVSLDGGEIWHAAALGKERASRAWVFWEYLWESPPAGDHTIAVRAFDNEGRTQPETEDTERINRYDNRWIHRVRVQVVRGAAG